MHPFLSHSTLKIASPYQASQQETTCPRTFTPLPHPRPNTLQTLPKLRLRAAELGEGRGEVFEFVVELFFDLGELLLGEGC